MIRTLADSDIFVSLQLCSKPWVLLNALTWKLQFDILTCMCDMHGIHVSDCLFTWSIVNAQLLCCSNYQYVVSIFHSVCSSEYHQQLSSETFELDLIEEEKLQQIAVNSANNYIIWLEGPWHFPPLLLPFRFAAVAPRSLAAVISTKGLSLKMAASLCPWRYSIIVAPV